MVERWEWGMEGLVGMDGHEQRERGRWEEWMEHSGMEREGMVREGRGERAMARGAWV